MGFLPSLVWVCLYSLHLSGQVRPPRLRFQRALQGVHPRLPAQVRLGPGRGLDAAGQRPTAGDGDWDEGVIPGEAGNGR